MPADSFDFDASTLRADGAEVGVFVEVLAAKLESALPAETEVRRRAKGFLSREKVVEAIEVTLGDQRYALQRRDRAVTASRAQEVRGVVIKRQPLELDAWVDALTAQLRELAEDSTAARTALERLVG
ncbi:hypothetical protein [Solirubrobacter soli]|uniref:hypothetical protein n=1 Tax=Solirubrobacter soli TaxID=363832 RepID=UPI0003F9EDF0|nr:hypothetical protein [Solirubrobacter soli]